MEEVDGDPEREQLKKDCDTVMHYTQIKPLASDYQGSLT